MQKNNCARVEHHTCPELLNNVQLNAHLLCQRVFERFAQMYILNCGCGAVIKVIMSSTTLGLHLDLWYARTL
jgi:hypothetical protein